MNDVALLRNDVALLRQARPDLKKISFAPSVSCVPLCG